ncbi:MAG: LptF/LptG family permease [Tannerellaceae bacterium]|jgi:lipopolysaccharide export system permease protein|nr:LptF/LptG family permease [Tannerellaceae bacterium]
MLQTFLPLFIMTFGICLFIVLMQFIWRYIDDMVGKGLDMLVLGEMFLYAALMLVPMALPLAILLASLMTFGNLGERLELLAMKSAGVSLINIMKPLIIFIGLVSTGAFFYQNNAMPVVQVKFYSLLYSMRQKSPELDIPEGVFFSGITNYNVYVKDKSDKNGLLKDIMIYDYSEGFNKARVFVADSGRLKMSSDKLFLVLTLYSGESFENLSMKAQSGSMQNTQAVPYRREAFQSKELFIEYDATFTRTDESFFQSNYIGKNLENLQTSIDSMSMRLDSMKEVNANNVYMASYKKVFPGAPQRGTKGGKTTLQADTLVLNFDSLYLAEPAGSQVSLLTRTKSSLEYLKSDNFFKAAVIGDESLKVRRHLTEWHNKFTVSFACLVFFFIGAPLGAIIRKGGLGTPVVLSVILFIFYYVINNIGFKMARDGVWPAWQGMWLSSAVLAPLGIFLTYKAVNDSVILNADTYLNALKNLIGRRSTRKVERKEVIIYSPDYQSLVSRLTDLTVACRDYLDKQKRWTNYFTYWKEGGKDPAAEQVTFAMEEIVEELSNADRNLVLNKLMDYPVIGGYKQLGAHLNKNASMLIGLFFPLGLPVYFIATYQRKLLRQDINTVMKVSRELTDMISGL